MTHENRTGNVGVLLASHLGLKLPRHEGHDLAGPCVSCQSSDAFRLHQQNGVAHCFSCGGRWSPYQLAETLLGDVHQARNLMIELGVFEPAPNQNGHSQSTPSDPLTIVARLKGISPESLRAYGAKAVSPRSIQLPCYGADAAECTTFTMSVDGGKGLFAKGKPAGLFLPHGEYGVRLPKPGETWHLVEGPKDAAALHGLGLLAAGLNTCRLAAKFGRLFVGTEIVLVPDRDSAGEEGAQFSARVLRGIAESIRVATLPAEFKESGGDDVRDVLQRPGGRDLVLQAILDAQTVESPIESTFTPAPIRSMEQIELPEGEPLTLAVHPLGNRRQRLVVVSRGSTEHRDRIDTDNSASRERLFKKVGAKFEIDRDNLADLIEPQLLKLADQSDTFQETDFLSGHEKDEANEATAAANMAAEWDLWHTPAAEPYVTIPVGSHREIWSVKSETLRKFISHRFFEEQGKAISAETLSSAANLIAARALFEGEEHDVHVRVASHNGNIYLDVCNDQWQVVEVTSEGWSILDESPVRFRRSRGMLPLPIPERGGSVDELRDFVNVDDATWPLVVGWLVSTFRPKGPYPLLALFAEQGSGKSTTARQLRSLIDPNKAPLRADPKDGRDLMIAANNSWCLAYDNLSHVPSWLSDALCRLSTGGGFATRELYTDQDEVIFDSQRPVLLTSIEEIATRSDLLDRCLVVLLPAIPAEKRRPEAELISRFEAARPRILGGLLTAVSSALKVVPNVKLSTLPRMADFAIWATAAETGLAWEPGTFLRAYEGNRETANDLALESSPIAGPLVGLLDREGRWSGTATELLAVMESSVTDQNRRQKGWPKGARALGGQLKRLAPNLRALGWTIELERKARSRTWIIERVTQTAVTSGEFASQMSREQDAFPVQNDTKSWEEDANDGNDAKSRTSTGDALDIEHLLNSVPF